ncbi:MAG TPA: hypothetical protein VGK32_19530 [Vicinamibacterales bacterium]|jgi:hypothetical protein
MKRLLIAAACLILVVACQKKPADSGATASQPAGQPAAAAQPAAVPAASAEPKKVEITEDLVTKYVEYQKENLVLVTKFVEETRKNIESAKGDTAKMLQQVTINDKLGKEMDDKLKAKRQALGLGDAEFEAVKDAAETVANGRMLYQQMGGDAQLAKMEADAKKQLAALPAAQREAAAAQMADMTKSLTSVRDGLDIRQKYGDKSADAVLKYADILAKQHFDAMKLMAGKK